MSKAHATVSVDDELLNKAKELGMNVSGLLENAIRNKIGGTETTIPAETGLEECKFCHRRMERQTRDDLTKGLIWLCPDEVWCCESCLQFKMRIIVVAT